MNRIIKTCSTALLLCTLAGTASAQSTFSQSDWAGALPDMAGSTYVDGVYPLGQAGKWGVQVTAGATGGNPGSFMSFGTYNTVWSVALEHNPGATYTFDFDYIINVEGNYTRWEVIGVQAGQTVTGINQQSSYGVGTGPSGGVLLANGDLGGVTTGWQSHLSGEIAVGPDISSVVFRINRNGNGNTDTFQAGFDNITIIPEPSTYAAFFGVFVLGIALWRRRATTQR